MGIHLTEFMVVRVVQAFVTQSVVYAVNAVVAERFHSIVRILFLLEI